MLSIAMPFSTPSLTRQNAFYIVDDNKSRSPLDPVKNSLHKKFIL